MPFALWCEICKCPWSSCWLTCNQEHIIYNFVFQQEMRPAHLSAADRSPRHAQQPLSNKTFSALSDDQRSRSGRQRRSVGIMLQNDDSSKNGRQNTKLGSTSEARRQQKWDEVLLPKRQSVAARRSAYFEDYRLPELEDIPQQRRNANAKAGKSEEDAPVAPEFANLKQEKKLRPAASCHDLYLQDRWDRTPPPPPPTLN